MATENATLEVYNRDGCSTNDSTIYSNTSDPVRPADWELQGIFVMNYILLVISVLGWINNILAIAVLQTKTYRGTATAFILTALACSDVVVVTTSAGHAWILSLTGYDVRATSSVACKLYTLFTFTSGQLSAWTIALLSVVRIVCVTKPLKVKQVFSLQNTIIAWSTIAVLVIGLNLFHFWMTRLHSINNVMMCVQDSNIGQILVIGNMMLNAAGSLVVIIPCNIVIITCMARRAVWRRRVGTPTSKQHKISSTTVMCTINSAVFIVMLAPVVTYYILLSQQRSLKLNYMTFIYGLVRILYNLNSCINFILYSVSSQKFRRATRSLFQFKSISANTPKASDTDGTQGSSDPGTLIFASTASHTLDQSSRARMA